jgi:hypothetical protein
MERTTVPKKWPHSMSVGTAKGAVEGIQYQINHGTIEVGKRN